MRSIVTAQFTCSDGDVRLEGKESEYVGRIGLCYRGKWTSVCDTNTKSDSPANVVCRQLGLALHS